MDVSSFLKLGMSLFSEAAQSDRLYVTQNQHFKVICGVHPTVCTIVWGELKQSMLVKDACKPKHLLQVLIFLKTYTTKSSLAVVIGVDEKTLRKWIFIITYAISDLEDDWVGSLFTKILLMSLTIVFLQIKWENRFHGNHGGSCLVTVDGTDFWIRELKPFTKDFYSHKFVKAGLHYEVGVCIQTVLIVWINGPFVVGKYNKITFFDQR